MRIKGKITTWNDEKGFGFITPNRSSKQVFVHVKVFTHRNRRPAIGQAVSYELSADKQGRPRAIKVTLAGSPQPTRKKRLGTSMAVAFAAMFLAVVGASALTERMPTWVLTFYLAASFLTFVVYALDKSAAGKGTWRTQESTLHLLSLLGGWPGALLAQQLLRHKSKKRSFRVVLWLTVLLNGGAFVWLLTPEGGDALRELVARFG